MIKKWLWLYFILLCSLAKAQHDIPIGTWRTHYSFRDSHSLADTPEGVFNAGSNSLFFLDKEDFSVTKIGKIDGLSDTEISTIGYHPSSNTLIIAYTNGNIDLLVGNKVFNIPTLLTAPVTVSKETTDIAIYKNLAYLSTDFGVVVVDLLRMEVQEAYTNIGANGEMLSIKGGDVYNDSLFLATPDGIMSGDLSPENNLQDYSNWHRYGPLEGLPTNEVSNIGSNSRRLFATVDFDGIYHFQDMSWVRLDFDLQNPILHITSGVDPVSITTPTSVLTITDNLDVVESKEEIYPKPQSTGLASGTLLVADSINGLVTSISGTIASVFPNGPFSDSIASLHLQKSIIFAIPAGYDQLGVPLRSSLGFYTFQEGLWTNYNATGFLETEPFPRIKDLVDVSYNPLNDRFYFASFGEGVVEWEPGNEVQILDESTPGSTLQNSMPPGRNVLVSSVITDNQGNVWVGNYGNSSPLHKYSPEDNSWNSFQTIFTSGQYPLHLELADNGNFWLRLDPGKGGGILVIDPESLDQKHLTNVTDQGGLPSRRVNDLSIDKTGQVWVATDNGVSHFPFPSDILKRSSINASPVLIDGRPLLKDEIVTCLAIDGGNRKWVGTEKGIWLFTPRGDSVIANFTNENSPLPSDMVIDVDINDITGEVFIATNAGIISYRGTATDGQLTNQQVKIFPNPVRQDYQGVVGISGLSTNAIVKVTDVTGKLVKETTAAGGTAVWDILDYQGRRVKSGVYLVFSSSSDGKETFIGKIAVVN